MKTFEEFKRCPELYGSEQIIQEDVLLYPAYVEYVKKETAKEILQELYDITFERKDPYSDNEEAKEVIDRAEILHTAKMYGAEVDE